MTGYAIDTQRRLSPFDRQEWLLTNGTGAYANGTVVGLNARRYHALFAAAINPPVGRCIFLNRVGEVVEVLGESPRSFELSINQFPGSLHPRGDEHLTRFEFDGTTVRWTYSFADVTVTKELKLLWKKNVITLSYTVDPGKSKVKLSLLPFISLRDFHSLLHKDWGHPATSVLPDQLRFNRGDLSLYLQCSGADWLSTGHWWFSHKYPIDTERGQEDTEDLYNPGQFEIVIDSKRTITLVAATDEIDVATTTETKRAEMDALIQVERKTSKTLGRLARAADDFIVDRRAPDGSAGTTILAGFPWFADWGRDTMIALPGLLLATGRFERARQVLTVFASYVSEGMIPNRFGDYTNEPEYNTVDASLWFVHAAFEYLKASGDQKTFDAVLLPACRSIVEGYRRGTRYGIRMDESDGLITQGDAESQLTWMDAKCNGIAFTPRQGKPVEINALWYHALILLGETKLAEKVLASFAKTFWNPQTSSLYDVVNGLQKDGAIRPNQIIAVSLPNSALSLEQQRSVVNVVQAELLTPMGLRSLSPKDSRYIGRYTGPQWDRDRSYHNGTGWVWLIGPFVEAYLRINDFSAEAKRSAKAILTPLIDQLEIGGCIGQLPENFDGDAPHFPKGCFAQAWSIGEVLRLAAVLEM